MSAIPPLPPQVQPRLEAVLAAIGSLIKQWRGEVLFDVGGSDKVAQNLPPPRVVCVPITSSIEAKKGTLGAIFTRAETVKIHIHGAGIAEVEELTDLVFNAINQVMTWAIRPGVGIWSDHGATTNGWAVLHEITLLIPIMRRETHAALVLEEQPLLEFVPQGS